MSVPIYEDEYATIYQGDVLEMLRAMPDRCVHMVVTSPPYWGLRHYGLPLLVWDDPGGCQHTWEKQIKHGVSGDTGDPVCIILKPVLDTTSAFCIHCGAWLGSLGLEPSCDLYVRHLVDIFREVRRIMRDDGTLWLNMGDVYAHDGKWAGETDSKQAYLPDADRRRDGREKRMTGLKPKNLVGMPWRVAFALQADGWYLRSDIIWSKPNAMPESVTDRPTKAHEYLFLLAKVERYYYDAEAIKEPSSPNSHGSQNVNPGWKQGGNNQGGSLGKWTSADALKGRNRRTVWEIATEPFPEAHFATFPTALVKPCILAGTSERGACAQCGAPWERIVDKPHPPAFVFTNRQAPTDPLVYRGVRHEGEWKGSGQTFQNWLADHPPRTIGWRPTCACDTKDTRPCMVLDPFLGSGTTVVVAKDLGRRAIGIELNPVYVDMAVRRLRQETFRLSP